MDFRLAGEERALVDALRQNLAKVCSTARLRAWEAAQASMDDDFEQAVAGGGFLAAGLPGGDCPSFAALTLLEEEAGRFLAPPVLGWLAGYAAHLLGNHPLADRIIAGEIVSPIPPTLQPRGLVRGVQFLDRARLLLGVDGGSVVVFEKDHVHASFVRTQSGVPRWNVIFDGSDPAERLPAGGDAFPNATAAEIIACSDERVAEARNRLRTCAAAWAVGAGSRAIELAVAYAGERQQFGHRIGSYQSVQNRLVDAAIQIEEARMLTYRAAALLDPDICMLARHLAGQAFVQASRAALMTFGGYGFTVDFDVQLYFRRAKEAQLALEPAAATQAVSGFRS